MREILHITNFGPIKEVKLDLGKVNILIGDQGTGKSTIAKLLFILNNDALNENEYDIGEPISVENEGWDKTAVFMERIFRNGLKRYLKRDSYISYTRVNGDRFCYNEDSNERAWYYPSSSHGKVIFPNFSSVYAPAERNLIPIIFENIFALNKLNIVLPEYLLEFAQLIRRVLADVDTFDFSEILGLKIKNLDGDIRVFWKSEEDGIHLKESSSGAQTLIPLLIYLEYLITLDKKFTDQHKFLLSIEEIEMNVFPDTQYKSIKKIIESIRYFLNDQLVLTTHSPYTLTTLNNLMYAGKIGQKNPELVSKIIPEQFWLNSEDVRAYKLIYDRNEGGCIEKNIMDEDSGLIASTEIDEVSDLLSEEFNKIMAIELMK